MASLRQQALTLLVHLTFAGFALVMLLCGVLPAPCARTRQTAAKADPETLRIEAYLGRISRDAAARQAFYSKIDRLVQQVRDSGEIPPALTLRAEWPAISSNSPPLPVRSTLSFPSSELFESLLDSLSLPQPAEIAPRYAGNNWPASDPEGHGIDPRVISRLLYWARKNGCPPQLALATAWQESRMSLDPPVGSSGEIGIMQILPARASAEGIDPKQLRDPDVNIWLGTMLLARYYQQEGTIAGAAMKYVAGPGVFARHYPADVRDYIAWYSKSVDAYASFFSRPLK